MSHIDRLFLEDPSPRTVCIITIVVVAIPMAVVIGGLQYLYTIIADATRLL